MATVADAMLHAPTLSSSAATVGELVDLLSDDHLHAAVLVDDDGRLVGVVERDDLSGVPVSTPARHVGRLSGRTTPPQTDLEEVRLVMQAGGRRRLAVVDDGRLLGLLCLKRSGQGFCSDADVRDRACG